MKIKTTKNILDMFEGYPQAFIKSYDKNALNKKWVAVDDVMDLLNNPNYDSEETIAELLCLLPELKEAQNDNQT